MLLPVMVIVRRERDAKASALTAARIRPIVLLMKVESLGIVGLGDQRQVENERNTVRRDEAGI